MNSEGNPGAAVDLEASPQDGQMLEQLRVSTLSRGTATLRYVVAGMAAVALVYAFLAAFRTVHDFDLGWQLASGRWIVEHRQIPSTDVLSYTGRGQPWIYPVFSGVLLYFVYLLGGYSALTLLAASASAATAFILMRGRQLATVILTIIAVPVIATRMTPRADLFSTVLFAAFLSILWEHHRHGTGKLWLLPLLSAAWANLHWGFMAGLGLCAAYVGLEISLLASGEQRAAAKQRLRKSWPWLLASSLAVLANPWGTRLYGEVAGWSTALTSARAELIREFTGVRLSWGSLQQALLWRAPESALWWLFGAALVAVVAAAAQQRFGAALLLLLSALAPIHRIRFQAMFACLLVVIGGSVLSDAWQGVCAGRRKGASAAGGRRLTSGIAAATCLCFTLLTGVRAYDLASNRYYSDRTEYAFGPGLSWWYPERAIAFIEHEHLPGNIFNDYNLGGYLTWRLPQYPVYIDGRGRPFGEEFFRRAVYELPDQPPDSVAWQQEADSRGIKTIIVSVARYDGLVNFSNLRAFCESQSWRPVYLDEVSAVFLRRTPETQAQIDRLQMDCSTVQFSPPGLREPTSRVRSELFNFWANTAIVLDAIGRDVEALRALDNAEHIFPDASSLHSFRGQILANLGNLPEAEREFRRAAAADASENNWSSLAELLMNQGRDAEALVAWRKAGELSASPQFIYLRVGQLHLRLQQPRPALAAFDDAQHSDVLGSDSLPAAADFHAQIAEGRAHAWWTLGDRQRALRLQEQAVRLTPQIGYRWRDLAAMYQAQGRTLDAQRAFMQSQPTGSSDIGTAPH